MFKLNKLGQAAIDDELEILQIPVEGGRESSKSKLSFDELKKKSIKIYGSQLLGICLLVDDSVLPIRYGEGTVKTK